MESDESKGGSFRGASLASTIGVPVQAGAPHRIMP